MSHSSLNLFSSSFLIVSRSLRLLISSFLLYYCFSLTLFSHPLSLSLFLTSIICSSFNNPFSHLIFISFSSGPPLFFPHSLLIILIFLSTSSFLILFFSHSFLLFFSRSFLLSFLSFFVSLFFSHCLSRSPPLSVSSFNVVSCHFLIRLLSWFSSLLSPALSKFYSCASLLLCILSCLILFSSLSRALAFLTVFLCQSLLFKICLFSHYRNYFLLELFSSLFLSSSFFSSSLFFCIFFFGCSLLLSNSSSFILFFFIFPVFMFS